LILKESSRPVILACDAIECRQKILDCWDFDADAQGRRYSLGILALEAMGLELRAQ